MFKMFRKNTDGNVAMMFSVTVLTLVLGIGAAVDFSSASSRKQNLQDMVDAATLAAARSKTIDPAELQAVVDTVVSEHNEAGHNITLEVQVIDGQVHVVGRTKYDTRIMGLAGKPTMNVSASAASPISGLTPVKVALVLDTTDSMSGDDITALKAASNALLDELDKFTSPVAVSVVPFGQYVNVGTGRKHASWLDVSKDGTTESYEYCWDEETEVSPRVCTKTGRTITYDIIRDGRNFGQGKKEEKKCTGGKKIKTGNRLCEMRTKAYTWNGCVGSRQSPHNEQAAFNLKTITGVMNETCGTELQELSTSFAAVRSTINDLSTSGSTYLPSGMMWGWRALQESEPLDTKVNLTKAGYPKMDPSKVLIFMTDGANTLSQGGSEPHLHEGSDGSEADERTLALCEGAKADGIQVFTVGYRMQDATGDAKTVLTQCATSSADYYDASDANALKEAFKDISAKLETARLSI